MKNVLVTGGSRGIGAETVRLFASHGYGVFFFYKSREEEALRVQKETGAEAIKCDVGCESDVLSAFEKIKKSCYGIDILVNNAGIALIKPFLDFSYKEWQSFTATTLDGAFFCTKQSLEHMISRKWGRIVNVASIWGEEGASCEVPYSTVKAGIIGFTKSLARELAPSGITVNCVSPGFIDTDMNSPLQGDEREEFISSIPLMRAGSTRDVASAIFYLCSEESAYITGQVLGVNGGLHT